MTRRPLTAALLAAAVLACSVACGMAAAGDEGLAAQAAVKSGEAAARAATPSPPPIVWKPVPYGSKRKAEIAAYCKRHYGDKSYVLKPKLVVLHFTAGGNWRSTWNYFANDVADPEFHELPGAAAHFIVDKNGTIYQLVATNVRGRHTYGLNHVAIGIEFVQEGTGGAHWADQQILARKAQINAGLRLVRYLQAKYKVKMVNIIGHSMARSNAYYKDLLRKPADHGDWQRADVLEFRARLRALR